MIFKNRYILGRAFYHIIQRRGFLGNRKEQGGDDSGKVKEEISTLTQEMNEAEVRFMYVTATLSMPSAAMPVPLSS